MKTINRDKIQRMIGNVGGNGGNGSSSADLAGYATQMWVEQNYISKEFFNTLFTIHGHDADDQAVPPTDVIIEPNDTETVLDSIEAMVGLWTEKYLSALGLSDGGGGGGDVLAEPLVSINGIGSPTAANQTLVWDGTRWTFKPYGQGGGSVTSIRITVPTGFNVSPSTAITTAGTFAITFASGYSLPSTADQANWNTAYTNNHTHSNKSVLDGITSTKVSNWDTAYSKATTLEGYFDTSGNAKSALKLTTVSKTAWGQIYWTANGVPDSISGDMTSVGNISFSASGKNIGGVAYFDTTNSRLGIGTTSPSTSLHVVGRVTCEYDSTKSGSFYATRGDYATYYGISSSGFAMITTAQKGASSSTVRITMTPHTAQEQYIMFGMSSNFIMGTGISGSTSTYRDGAYIQIGGARIVWDNTNTALKVVSSDGTTAANFYATGAVSALGANTSGGGGIPDNYVTTNTEQTITGAKIFNTTIQINKKLTVNSSVQAIGGFFSSQGSVSVAHDITGGGNLTMNGTATIGSGLTSNGVTTLQVYSGKTVTFSWASYGATPQGTLYEIRMDVNSRFYLKTTEAPRLDYNWASHSDIRQKNILKYIDMDINRIANAPIFDFTWKNDNNHVVSVGTSAQYWESLLPNAVKEDETGTLFMDYTAAALASSIITARKVQNHEDRIAYLERENEQLRNEIKQLKAA